MDDERIEELLMAVGAGDRVAFKALFDEAAPAIAARLAFRGVAIAEAETAICDTFAELWEGEYAVRLHPGQRLGDWLGALVEGHAPHSSAKATSAAPITPALWQRAKRRAFPESWRNMLKRSDVLFLVLGAVIWALILWMLGG